jgi:hypothetical protein
MLTIFHDDIKPDLGKAEFDVWIDIDIEGLSLFIVLKNQASFGSSAFS